MKKNITEGWERVSIVMNHYGLNKNSFSKEIGIKNNVAIGRIINEKRKPIRATLEKIVNRFPEINLDWLLTGNGDMLIDKPNVEVPKEAPPVSTQLELNFEKIVENNSKLVDNNTTLVDTNTKLSEQIIKLSNEILKLKKTRPAAGKARAVK
jgi:hypothetical protein